MTSLKGNAQSHKVRCRLEWLILFGFFSTIISLVWLIKSIVPKSARSDEKVIKSELSSNQLLQRQIYAGDYDDRIAIRIERGPCFKMCPDVYKAAIFHSGQGMFSGKKGEVTGDFFFRVGSSVLHQLLSKTEEISLWHLLDEYNSHVQDGATTFCYVNSGRKRKQIRDLVKAPKKLRELELLIDEAIFATNFTKRETRL